MIQAEQRKRNHPANRRDGNDTTVFPALEVRQYGAGDVHNAQQIGVELRLNLEVSGTFESTKDRESSIVDQRINKVKIANGIGNGFANACGVGYIQRIGPDIGPGGKAIILFRRPHSGCYILALLGKVLGSCLANTT